jgi:parvulin-like peptidyl-prolyl isomerase
MISNTLFSRKTHFMKIFYFGLLSIGFLINLQIYAQDFNDKPVARVGNSTISSSEFLQRYELTPVFRKENKSMKESIKLEFLYSLMAEKLWALEAKDLRYDTTNVIKFITDRFTKMFVRDALYQREIKDKVQILDAELIKSYNRYNTTLEVNYLVDDKKDVIDKLYSLLKAGVPFDSVLSLRPEKSEQANPQKIVFGQMDESIEDSLYSLKLGAYTAPIYSPEGWYIFRLKNKSIQALSSSEEDLAANVKKTLEGRQELKIYREFYDSFFKDKKVTANAFLLRSLSSKIAKIFAERKKAFNLNDTDKVNLDVQDVIKIEREFGVDSLQMPVFEFENGSESLKYFIEAISFDGFSSKKVDIKSVASVLDMKVRAEMEHELLASEGLKEGLDKLPQVQKDIEMWRSNYMAQALQSKFLDSANVSDNEVYDYYKKFYYDEYYPEQVNIIEVLTDSPEVVEKVLAALKNGEDIRNLARLYTQRSWTKNKDGEFGYFPVVMYGDIGKIAATMKVGDIYGPLKVPEGYSIFKLIGKKEPQTKLAQPFDKVKDDLRKELEYRKEHKAITDYTVKLAKKFGISIDGNTLKEVQVTNLNAFGFRYLGFGGQTTAVPIMMPNVDWVDQYIESSNIAP